MRVLDASDVDGELEVTVETIDASGWCRECGVKARSKGRRDTLVRDVAAFDRPVAVAGAQAPLAVPRTRVSGQDLERGLRRDRAARGADRPRPAGGMSPCRP
jgi:hypothetical protein